MSQSPSTNQRTSELEAQHHELEATYHRIEATYYQLEVLYEQIPNALSEIENADMQANRRIEEHDQEYNELDTMAVFLDAYLDELRHEIPFVLGVIKRDAQAHIRNLLEALRSSED